METISQSKVRTFISDIDSFAGKAEELVNAVRSTYLSEKESMARELSAAGDSEKADAMKRRAAALEKRRASAAEYIAKRIAVGLDAALPDESVSYIYELMAGHREKRANVNGGSDVRDGILDMCVIDYPIYNFSESELIASAVKKKCARLLTDGDAIKLPVIFSADNAPPLLVNDESGNSADDVRRFVHSVMFGFLSSLPVSGLRYSVIAPESGENSILPFLGAREKVPGLFGEKIFVSEEDISAEISRLGDKVTSIPEDKPGSRDETVFGYAGKNANYAAGAEMLVIFDFPKGFDDRTLAALRNILKSGSRCGVYTVIAASRVNGEPRSIDEVQKLSKTAEVNNGRFTLNGLPLEFFPAPDKPELAGFFNKYMLVSDGGGLAFTPLVRKLIEIKAPEELDSYISLIDDVMKNYKSGYAHVPDMDALFPSLVTLGYALYPADIFSGSSGFRKITDKFGNDGFVELPLTLDMNNGLNLFLDCPDGDDGKMLPFTHHMIWSFLSFIPLTKVNICVFDAEQRGNSILPFLDFRGKSPETFDRKIYTNGEAMLERLQKINAQIDEFIQDKLGNRYRNILDYNLNTPSSAEPLTLLVLYDFPSGMDGRSLDILSSILRNGNKCGVFTIICYNPDITFSRYENIDEKLDNIRKYCAAAEYRDGHYLLPPYGLRIDIPNAPEGAAADDFIREYAEKSEQIKKRGVSFRGIIPKELFSLDSSGSMRIPVGIGDGNSTVEIILGKGSSHHGLIAGATGSGKSTLLHTLIMSAMLNYTPEQLNLYLMDFKSGTEFKIYESVKLPHIKLLALDAMQEFGESILENLVSEMEHRGTLFKEAGQSDLKGYVRETGKPLPRILVIMDEFQILFNDSADRKVAMNCAELTKRIVTEGRAFGIHLMMATQSTKVISDLTLSRGTIEQMRIRIGLKCSEDDARYLFSDRNDAKALSMMRGPIGTAVMNLDYTEQDNIGFRAAYCDDETRKEYLGRIAGAFSDREYTLQIFEGSRTVRLLDHYRDNGIGLTDESPVTIHMGTLIKVAPPFTVSIDKKRKHNLLICGSNEKMAGTISGNYIISALLNRNTAVYCIDGDLLVGDESSVPFYDALAGFKDRFRLAGDREDIISFINDVYDKYRERKKHNSSETIFVVIKNLQFLDIVKSMLKGEHIDESEYTDDEPAPEPAFDPADPIAAFNSVFADKGGGNTLSTGEKLIKMIVDGSGFGIHFAVTSLEYQTVREAMYYGENVLNRFPERIIFSLGANDAANLIENVSIDGLRNNTVYYTDGIRNTFQMKPYITPSPSELKSFVDTIL